MVANESAVKKNGLSYRQTVVVAIVSSVLSGSGIPYILSTLGINPYRDDPFTGTQGRAFDKRLEKVETYLTRHTSNHPDRALEIRINILETKLEVIIDNQQRILEQVRKN